MSHSSIIREIRKYIELRDEAEEELRKYEKELEELLAFQSRFSMGKEEFDYNLNNRRNRAKGVNDMSKNIKSGQAYYSGMNEDLTGKRYQDAMNNVDSISDKIKFVIRLLEDEIEKLKGEIAEYSSKISDLEHQLSREHHHHHD